jgi:hypothetical protein
VSSKKFKINGSKFQEEEGTRKGQLERMIWKM